MPGRLTRASLRPMKVLLQRVSSASVRVDGRITGEIAEGLMLLVGFGAGDTENVLAPMAQKLANLRVFANDEGRFHFSLLDRKGGALLVPQFTLFADTSRGRRPDFAGALEPKEANRLFELFVTEMRKAGVENVQTGVFGANMQVSLVNDGPVTFLIEM